MTMPREEYKETIIIADIVRGIAKKRPSYGHRSGLGITETRDVLVGEAEPLDQDIGNCLSIVDRVTKWRSIIVSVYPDHESPTVGIFRLVRGHDYLAAHWRFNLLTARPNNCGCTHILSVSPSGALDRRLHVRDRALLQRWLAAAIRRIPNSATALQWAVPDIPPEICVWRGSLNLNQRKVLCAQKKTPHEGRRLFQTL